MNASHAALLKGSGTPEKRGTTCGRTLLLLGRVLRRTEAGKQCRVLKVAIIRGPSAGQVGEVDWCAEPE